MKNTTGFICIILFLTMIFSCSSDPVESDEALNETNANRSALEITSTIPEAGAEVSVQDSVILTFSNDLDCSTVNENTIKVGLGMSGAISCSQNVIVFKPDLAFNFAVAVQVTVSKDVKDIDGTGLADDFDYIFYTEVEPGG
jgi:hypothetical protein